MEPQRPRIVIAEPFRPDVVDRLRRHADVVELGDHSPDKLVEAVRQADAILVRMRAHITARVIEAAPRLRVIGRAGASLDHIDMRAAARRDIMVVHTPTVAIQSVADYTIALMLAAARRLLWYDRHVRANQFDDLRDPYGLELRHQTIGIVGGGQAAAEVARVMSDGFRSRVIHHIPPGVEPIPLVPVVELSALLRESDIVTLHLPVSDRHAAVIKAEELSQMKPTACLVNTSRGSAVDHFALAEALKTHRIAGAALDVFDAEPLPGEHPLRNAPNCLLSPHVASATRDVSDGYYAVAEDVLRILNGEPPLHAAAAPKPKAG